VTVLGRWLIVETELWDAEALDLVEPAFIEFGKDGMGRFGFIAVEGWMDCLHEERDGRSVAEFTWDGSDDCDHASGRGWAALQEDGALSGRIYFHLGDDSGFRAVRAEAESSVQAMDAAGGELRSR
jgi:hypothetical protein